MSLLQHSGSATHSTPGVASFQFIQVTVFPFLPLLFIACDCLSLSLPLSQYQVVCAMLPVYSNDKGYKSYAGSRVKEIVSGWLR